jgi:sugar lactone lactonase YvrE
VPRVGLAAGLCLAVLSAAGQPTLEEVAQVDEAPGNITVTPRGRIVLSLHQFFAPALRVAELRADGTLAAFPDERWNSGDLSRPDSLDAVLGVQSDARGIVWMLDNGLRGKSVPKLVGWDSEVGRLARILYLPPPVTREDSFVNDLAVDSTHGAVFVADPAGGASAALIVVDLMTGLSRRVLEGDRSVVPEDVDLVVEGRPVEVRRPDGSLVRPRVGVNPIALDPADAWLYFGPMHGRTLYRLRTRDLLDASLSGGELARRVEAYASRPVSDGISVDRGGNVYITDLAAGALGVITADRQYRVLVADPRLSWPDAYSFGPDGYLYTVANQLHRSAALSAGEAQAEPPFPVLRVRPLAPGVPGR